MSSKDEILANCRKNIHRKFDMPDLSDIEPLTFPDPRSKFVQTCGDMGAKVIEVGKNDDIDKIIKETFPDAKKIASNMSGIKCAGVNPDDVAEPAELDSTDVGIIPGSFGVAENGCIWIPQTMRQKAVCFISENLVVVMPASAVVSNMHEAYRRVKFNDYGYGTFISGPSKTADIAQVLVVGAQAARSLTVLLVDD